MIVDISINHSRQSQAPATATVMQGSKGGQVSLLNIITELKKTCNHPFLFESAEEDYRGGEDDLNAVDRLVVTSGKMVLLDKLMKRLKETGHRFAPPCVTPELKKKKLTCMKGLCLSVMATVNDKFASWTSS